jgi:hypothetical protein
MGEKPKPLREEQPPKWLQDLLAGLQANQEAAGLALSLAAVAAGAALMLDDYKDFGKDGSERDPPMPHHWLLGALTLLGGVAGACASGAALLKRLPKPRRESAEKLPPSLLEQGASIELVEKYR